jgi:hypothetical protein
MKFLCLPCDQVMEFAERQIPGDGTMAAVFTCGACGRDMAMLTNPMETQLVSSLGVKVGGREVPGQPMELVRTTLADGRHDAFADEPAGADLEGAGATDATDVTGVTDPAPASESDPRTTPGRVTWSADARDRLANVPSFVRGMVKRIYTDYARERGITTITPAVMDRARTELGLEGM